MKMKECQETHKEHKFLKLMFNVRRKKAWFYCGRCLKIIIKDFKLNEKKLGMENETKNGRRK